ncbi:hypothetical protein [Streptomyces longispororuber]|uniref:hypothetical protein n=1 Tax=Streptomyces longispororuber TaxID=68230 RepID=UPI00210DAD15|nr:hypothetical protein [Streptomyces longispororuber]MCQ4206906.1 hypothetical protein [Streptomyces longispororuber]
MAKGPGDSTVLGHQDAQGDGVVIRLSPTVLRINARTWGDSSGSHFAGPDNGADVVNTKWYRNDELVGGGPAFEIVGLPTVAESANYRLETEARRENQPTWASKADASTDPDLPAPRYDIPTDGYGKLSGGKDLQFTLATGNRPTSAELSYSVGRRHHVEEGERHPPRQRRRRHRHADGH